MGGKLSYACVFVVGEYMSSFPNLFTHQTSIQTNRGYIFWHHMYTCPFYDIHMVMMTVVRDEKRKIILHGNGYL